MGEKRAVLMPTEVSDEMGFFDRFAARAATFASRAHFFAFCVVLIVVWALCLYKAHNGGRWKLPLVGDLAERRIVSRV